MQRLGTHPAARGFSLLELLCVTAIIAILAALLLPALAKVRDRAKQTQCAAQLKDIGVGFHAFAHDHNSLFPMQVPIASGGTLEFAQRASQFPNHSLYGFRHFQALSNELVTPKLLVCPTDLRTPAPGFPILSNAHLSYFAGLNADFHKPASLLAGDRNLTNDWAGVAPLQRLGPTNSLRWSHELHRFRGNLLFADGHVEQSGSAGLLAAVQGGAGGTFVLNLPTATITAPSRAQSLPGGPASAPAPAPTQPPSQPTVGPVLPPDSLEEPESPPNKQNPPLPPPRASLLAQPKSVATPGSSSPPASPAASGSNSSPELESAAIPAAAGAPPTDEVEPADTAVEAEAEPEPFLADIPSPFKLLGLFYLALLLLSLLALYLRRRLAASKQRSIPPSYQRQGIIAAEGLKRRRRPADPPPGV